MSSSHYDRAYFDRLETRRADARAAHDAAHPKTGNEVVGLLWTIGLLLLGFVLTGGLHKLANSL